MHFKSDNCKSNKVVLQTQEGIQLAKKSNLLFPKSLSIGSTSVKPERKLFKGNGGWGDKRDQDLCMNMTMALA